MELDYSQVDKRVSSDIGQSQENSIEVIVEPELVDKQVWQKVKATDAEANDEDAYNLSAE